MKKPPRKKRRNQNPEKAVTSSRAPAAGHESKTDSAAIPPKVIVGPAKPSDNAAEPHKGQDSGLTPLQKSSEFWATFICKYGAGVVGVFLGAVKVMFFVLLLIATACLTYTVIANPRYLEPAMKTFGTILEEALTPKMLQGCLSGLVGVGVIRRVRKNQ